MFVRVAGCATPQAERAVILDGRASCELLGAPEHARREPGETRTPRPTSSLSSPHL